MTTWPSAHRPAPTATRTRGGRGRSLLAAAGGGPVEGSAPSPLLVVLLVVGLAVLFAVPTAWRASGGRWAVVETGSMGTAVPVGSLILTRPRPVETLGVGDIVTYRPPNLRSMYTHRVVGVEPGGAVRVQGDENGAVDPWPVTQELLVGKVVWHGQGLGWLARTLPMVLLGSMVLRLATGLWVPLRWRSSARVIGTCLLFAAVTALLRPFVHPVLVAATTDSDGTTLRATVSSAGMLPTRVHGAPGQHVDLLSGQVGSVVVAPPGPGHPLVVDGTAHLTGWWLVAVGAVCLLPMLWVLVVGLAEPAPADERS